MQLWLLAAQAYSEIYPHLVNATRGLPNLVKIDDMDWSGIDAAFCCLPHATTQEVIKSLPSHVKVVDLSADFRLQNVDTYREWCVPGPRTQDGGPCHTRLSSSN